MADPLVPDPFDDALANIGADFELYMAGLKKVTVASIDPDPGTATATATDVPALKRSRRRFPLTVGTGGLSNDQCRFVFRASRCDFALKHRDQITDADGIVWEVDERGASLIAMGSLWACDVTIKR